jgi:sirohydrochlorin cobaltochelatase
MSSLPLSGAVLLGHGSREPATEGEIRELCAGLASAHPDRRFAHAFLNQEPKLETAVAALVDAGCTRITVLPLLVFIGRHMIDDVPAELDRLRARHPAVTFDLEPYLFRLPGFSDLISHTLNRPGHAPAQERSA